MNFFLYLCNHFRAYSFAVCIEIRCVVLLAVSALRFFCMFVFPAVPTGIKICSLYR